MTDNASTQARAAEVRNRIHAAVGQVVLALTVVPRYWHQSIVDLQTLVLEPLMRDRIAIATAAPEVGPDGVRHGSPGGALAGIAFWASVSDAINEKIREQIKAGAFRFAEACVGNSKRDGDGGDVKRLRTRPAPSIK